MALEKGDTLIIANQDMGYLFTDITNAFSKNYKRVVLLTGSNFKLKSELNDNVNIVHIPSYNRKNLVTRKTSWFRGFFSILMKLLFTYKKGDLFLSTNPPLQVFLPLFLKRRRISCMFYDIYPDGLLAAKFVKSERSLLYKFWKWANIIGIKNMDHIFTITDSLKERIKKYAADKEIHVVPVWVKSGMNLKVPRDENLFLKKYDLPTDKFYVVYSGNLGLGHNVEMLLDIAEKMVKDEKVYFIIAGKGYKYDLIKNELGKRMLPNVRLYEPQDDRHFTHLMALTDVGVVTLEEEGDGIAIPSKTFNIMGAGIPVLCIASPSSELGKLVLNNELGEVFRSGDVIGAVEYLDKLSQDQDYYSRISYNCFQESKNYSAANADKIARLSLGKS